jgi:phospholipase D1/2
MSLLFHKPSPALALINRISDDAGSMHVQVLRSCGKWSLGIKTECSIMNCWIETIKHAEKVIYVESQFFVGNLAGEGVLNGVPAAICDRIVRAFEEKVPLRVVVIIPMHPNGDFINAKKSKVVLHYQSCTINKCKTSLFSQLAKRAPGIVISDYIGIYSLRNWGVINGKVYSEQVYVHDKLLIVDDRVVVLGSANINDRSMLGSRDTEMAIRIEDSKLIQTTMGGQPYVVGTLPHSLRLRLMRHHLADESVDIADLLNEELYRRNWAEVAVVNSAVYDELDGNTSMYRVTRTEQHQRAFAQFAPKSASDPMVAHSLTEIRGFLVEYPQKLLGDENNAPSLAMRAIVPNELWV